MTRVPYTAVAVLILVSSLSFGQIDKIALAAGSPEDKDLTAIGNEQDPQKKISMYQDYLQKYASNPMAEAYGNWQLSQAYQAAGDFQKAIETGDKALATSPHNLDVLTSQILIAQQMKDNAKIFQYAVQGGDAYDSIDKAKKPDGVTDEQFQSEMSADKEANKNTYQFFQATAFGVISNENDAKTRMDYIEKFTAAFPKSGLDDQLTSYAMLSLSELKDNQRLISYAEKALVADPENLSALILLANTYVQNPGEGSLTKAITYAQRAVTVAKADDPAATKSRKVSAGVAHCVLGQAYAKQEKTATSITELKSAISLLKGEDDQQFALAAYFLGWDYAKTRKLTEARAILEEGVAIPGPVQGPIKDLLTKVNTARASGK